MRNGGRASRRRGSGRAPRRVSASDAKRLAATRDVLVELGDLRQPARAHVLRHGGHVPAARCHAAEDRLARRCWNGDAGCACHGDALVEEAFDQGARGPREQLPERRLEREGPGS